MAASGTLTVSGSVTGMLAGSRTIGPITISTTNASPSITEVVLASGANTITAPTATSVSAVVINFAAASTVTKTLKGVTGDTGVVSLMPNGFVVLTFLESAPPTTFVITAGAADTGNVTEISWI